MATVTSGFTTPLIKPQEVAQGTMAFHFVKPPAFEFRAGQSIDMTLRNPPESEEEGNTRACSIASAPFDGDLMIATRLRDIAFKRTLRTLALGAASQRLRARALAWCKYVGDDGDVIKFDRFGASAPGDVVMEKLGFNVGNVIRRVRALLGLKI